MNLEEAKKMWSQDHNSDLNVNQLFRNKTNYQSPFNRIKRDLKIEFIITWIFILFGISFIAKHSFFQSFNAYYLLGILFMGLVPIIYYHIKFFRFYKETFIKGVNTYIDLIKFTNKMSDFISDYRTYNLFVLIIISNFLYRVIQKTERMQIWIKGIRDEQLEYVFFTMLLFIISFLIIEIYIYFLYKKPLNQIKKIITEIEKQEIEPS